MLGAGIAFTITNSEKIRDLIYREPKVQIVTEDDYLKIKGQITIKSRGEKEYVVVSDSFPTALKAFSLAPGAYHLVVRVSDEIVYERDFTVEKGDVRTLSIPSLGGASIRVSVDNLSGHIGPGSQLSFRVSGNGDVWVFASRPESLHPLDSY